MFHGPSLVLGRSCRPAPQGLRTPVFVLLLPSAAKLSLGLVLILQGESSLPLPQHPRVMLAFGVGSCTQRVLYPSRATEGFKLLPLFPKQWIFLLVAGVFSAPLPESYGFDFYSSLGGKVFFFLALLCCCFFSSLGFLLPTKEKFWLHFVPQQQLITSLCLCH